MNKNFFKATGRAAKITGKDVNELRKHFNKKATDAPAELVSALITDCFAIRYCFERAPR